MKGKKRIESKGAQYLGEALRNNSVRDHHSFFLLYSIISLFSISYRHSLHSTFTRIKSEIKVHNIWLKHYETIQWEIITPSFSFIPSFHSFPFRADTHYAQSWQESNRRSRCTISGWIITKQFSERSLFLLILLLPPLFHHFTFFHFIQTLTILYLPQNQIGAQGAQYLAEALQHNTVRDHHSSFFFFLYSSFHSFSFYTDTH